MSRVPILTCTRQDSSVKVFLASKYKRESNSKEVYLEGKGIFGGTTVNFENRVTGDRGHRPNVDAWQLQVSSSGDAKLISFEDHLGSDWIVCNEKNVFSVTQSNYTNGPWEKSIKEVKLKLDNCKVVDEVETCDILIESNVGLGWKPEFQPKAFFK